MAVRTKDTISAGPAPGRAEVVLDDGRVHRRRGEAERPGRPDDLVREVLRLAAAALLEAARVGRVQQLEQPEDPGEVFADSSYRGSHFTDAVRARGGVPRIIATGMWGRDEVETAARLQAWNQPIHRVRGRIEKIFGTWKRSYGLRRMRWRGLAKAACQVRLTAIAYNLKRSLTIQAAA